MAIFSTIGKVLGASSAKKAANVQAREARRSTNEAIGFLEEGRDMAFERLEPFREQGLRALDAYSGFLMGDTPAEDLPINRAGLDFRLKEGMGALTDAASARGGLSGGELKGLERFRMGLATDELDRSLARLSGLAGMGQQASGAQANAALGAGGQIGQTALTGGMAAGEARASSFLNNPFASGFNQVGQTVQGLAGLGFGDSQGRAALRSTFGF